MLLLLALAACVGPADDTDDTDAPTGDTEAPPVVEGCRAGRGAPDRLRYGVVAHPYDESGAPSDAWEVLALAADGTVTRPGRTFEMGRATGGPVVFTPDGSLGVAVQEDGTLGVFTLDAEGVPSVVHAGFGDFYASAVTMDRSGERLQVLDGNWPENGGAVIEATIDCDDGTLSVKGPWLGSKLASGLHLLPDGRSVLVADGVVGEDAPHEAWLLDAEGEVLGGSAVFPDDEAIVSTSALTPDGGHLLVGDFSAFFLPNRIGVVAIGDTGLTALDVVSPVEDPVAIVPWGGRVLVASGFGDALLAFAWDEGTLTPLGELAYVGAPPQLPSAAVTLDLGDGRARIAVAEVSGIRTVLADGTSLVDEGLSSFGEGLAQIAGAVGFQP